MEAAKQLSSRDTPFTVYMNKMAIYFVNNTKQDVSAGG